MPDLYPYQLTTHQVTYIHTAYPENYFGDGWPDRIGPPETWGQHVGYDTVDRYTTPGPPWSGGDLETLTWLIGLPFIPGYGPYIGQLSSESYDPPDGKRFLSSGAEFTLTWQDDVYQIIYWSEATWGRFNYKFTGIYTVLEKRPVYSPSCSIIPCIAPLLPLVLLLSGMTSAISGGKTNPTPGRRRRAIK